MPNFPILLSSCCFVQPLATQLGYGTSLHEIVMNIHKRYLNGSPIARDELNQIIDDSFYLMFNSNFEPVSFTIPDERWGHRWLKVLDTSDGTFLEAGGEIFGAKCQIEVKERSMILLMHKTEKVLS
jgi:pullulanase/glycogen debranching enzyme